MQELLKMDDKQENLQSPDTVLQDFLMISSSETESSKASTSDVETPHHPKPASKWSELRKNLRGKLKKQMPNFHRFDVLHLSTRFSSSMRKDVSSGLIPIMKSDFNYFKPQWKNFALSELQTATKNFCKDNIIGKGGYAEVYKGCLRTGQYAAIKRLTRNPNEDRIGDFLTELGIMAHINHPNTAKLIGYGVEGGLYLVLELSPNGSLASLLQSSKEKLDWNIRYQIALGIAKGLLYLHEGCQRRIIHRDIKAANILLTKDFEPQICDFGLAKWLPEQWTHLCVLKFEGTFGYLAPEFLLHGIVDEKTDIFAFGVLLLELITGRRALDYTQQSLVMWANPLLKKNRINELVDPLLTDYNQTEMNLMILAAFLCVQESSVLRPRISQVLLLLRGSCGSIELVKTKKLSYWKKYYEELFNAEDYNKATGSNGIINPTNKQFSVES